ncbi:hypothetical protein NQZ68_031194, partial [Dissostichus eleginoides]
MMMTGWSVQQAKPSLAFLLFLCSNWPPLQRLCKLKAHVPVLCLSMYIHLQPTAAGLSLILTQLSTNITTISALVCVIRSIKTEAYEIWADRNEERGNKKHFWYQVSLTGRWQDVSLSADSLR